MRQGRVTQVKFVSKYDERKGKDRAIEAGEIVDLSLLGQVERYIRSSHSPPPQRPPAPSARRDGDWDCLSATPLASSSSDKTYRSRPEMQLDGLRIEERRLFRSQIGGKLTQGIGFHA